MPHNPIRQLDTPKGNFLIISKPPVAAPHTELVIYPRKGPAFCLPAGSQMRHADYRNAIAIYEVDLSPIGHEVGGVVESISDLYIFQAKARVNCHIENSLKVIERKVSNTYDDIKNIVLQAIASTTRDLDPKEHHKAQQIVRNRLEGPGGGAKSWFGVNGYALDHISIVLNRDSRLIKQTEDDEIFATDTAREIAHQDRTRKVVEFNKEMLSGDSATRYAYLISLDPSALAQVLQEITTTENAQKQIVYEMIGRMIPHMDSGRQEILLQWLQQTAINPHPLLPSNPIPGLLPDSDKKPKGPSPKFNQQDDWDDQK